ARRARRDLGERARRLHRPRAEARAACRAGVRGAARHARLPADQGSGGARALAAEARGGRIVTATRDLLFELGTEQLPAGYVPPALAQLEAGVRAGLETLRLGFGGVQRYGTPRRLSVLVHRVAEKQAEKDEEVMGPAARVAFDAEGRPTRALLGFCAGEGVEPSAVRRGATPKGEYVAVTVPHAGRPALDALPPMLAEVAQKLQYPKSMRWDDGDYRAGRPVRWLLALFGGDVVPVRAFGLEAERTTFGHRFLHPG